MSRKKVPLIKNGYFKFEFPTYDELSQEVKDLIAELFVTEQFNTAYYLSLDYYTELPLVYTDEETGISVPYHYIYIYLFPGDYFIEFWNEEDDLEAEKMTHSVFETNLCRWVLSESDNDTWLVDTVCPLNIEFYVDDVLTPLSDYRAVITYNRYNSHNDHDYFHSSADFPLSIEDTLEKEFPDVIIWSDLKDMAKKGHLVLFNYETWYGNLYNIMFQDIFMENSIQVGDTEVYICDAIEAVYIPYGEGQFCKYVQLKNFVFKYISYSGQLCLYDENDNMIYGHYYVIMNPQNITLNDESLLLVTGKLSFDMSEVHNGSGDDPFAYYNFYHFAVDNCGFHVFNDIEGDAPDYTIVKSFPEHQIHDVVDAIEGTIDSFSNNLINDPKTYKYLNFGGSDVFNNSPGDMFHLGCLIDGVEYKIVGIKSISSNYDGYVSESYLDNNFDPEGNGAWREFTHIVSYDNHGYGNTSHTTVTAWVIPVISDEMM